MGRRRFGAAFLFGLCESSEGENEGEKLAKMEIASEVFVAPGANNSKFCLLREGASLFLSPWKLVRVIAPVVCHDCDGSEITISSKE